MKTIKSNIYNPEKDYVLIDTTEEEFEDLLISFKKAGELFLYKKIVKKMNENPNSRSITLDELKGLMMGDLSETNI